MSQFYLATLVPTLMIAADHDRLMRGENVPPFDSLNDAIDELNKLDKSNDPDDEIYCVIEVMSGDVRGDFTFRPAAALYGSHLLVNPYTSRLPFAWE